MKTRSYPFPHARYMHPSVHESVCVCAGLSVCSVHACPLCAPRFCVLRELLALMFADAGNC